jgi:dehydrogenase/reductase SDR family member 1
VAVVSIWPALVRTEFTSMGAVETDDGRLVLSVGGGPGLDLSQAESPRFSGRAVVALAADPGVMARSGRAWTTAELAHAYGFTDVDGRVPEVLVRPRHDITSTR